jgi:hypothetical protein
MLRFPHFLGNRLICGGKVVSPTCRSPFTPKNIQRIFLVLISFKAWVDLRAVVRLEGLGKLKKSSDFIGTWTRDLPACSIVPQPTTLPRVPGVSVPCVFTSLLNGSWPTMSLPSKVKDYPCNKPWRPIGHWDVEVPPFLNNQLTGSDEFVNITRRPLFILKNIPGTHFC